MSTQAHAGSARHTSWLASPPASAAVEQVMNGVTTLREINKVTFVE